MGFLSAPGDILLALKFPGITGQITPPPGVPTGGLFTTGQDAIRAGLSFFLIIVLLLAILYGFMGVIRYIYSRGDKQKIQGAREKITYSIVGLIIAFLAFVLVGIFSSFVNVPFISTINPACGGLNQDCCGVAKFCNPGLVCEPISDFCVSLTPTPAPCGTVCGGSCGPSLCLSTEVCCIAGSAFSCSTSSICSSPTSTPTPTGTPAPTPIPTSTPTPTPTVIPCLIISGVCSGCVSILLVPNPQSPGNPVLPSATGLNNCIGKNVFFREDSCNNPNPLRACNIPFPGSGCTAISTFPAPLSPTNIFACIDKDGGIVEFNDPGESAFKLLSIIGGVTPTPTPTSTPTPKPTSTPTPTPTPKPTSTPTPSPTPTPILCTLSDSDGGGYFETCKDSGGIGNSIRTFKDYCDTPESTSGFVTNAYSCNAVTQLCEVTLVTNCNNSGQVCVVQPNGQPVCKTLTFTVNGFVWVDSNENGEVSGEPGFIGATVKALFPNNTVALSVNTGSSGYFEFLGLAAGQYKISLTVPDGFKISAGSVVDCSGDQCWVNVDTSFSPVNVYNTFSAFGILPL